MKFFIFSKIFRPNKNLFFRKFSKFTKFQIFDFSDFVNFWDFSKKYFCVLIDFFRKNKIFQNTFYFSFCLYYVLAVPNFQVRGPVRKQFTVPPTKKNVLLFPKFPPDILFRRLSRQCQASRRWPLQNGHFSKYDLCEGTVNRFRAGPWTWKIVTTRTYYKQNEK